MLEKRCWRASVTYSCQSGSEALDVYIKQKDEIDLIILDMIMPEMSGGETYERIGTLMRGLMFYFRAGTA